VAAMTATRNIGSSAHIHLLFLVRVRDGNVQIILEIASAKTTFASLMFWENAGLYNFATSYKNTLCIFNKVQIDFVKSNTSLNPFQHLNQKSFI